MILNVILANHKMDRLAELPRGLVHDAQPLLEVLGPVRIRNPQRVLIDRAIIDPFDTRSLVAWLKLGQRNLTGDDDLHGSSSGPNGSVYQLKDKERPAGVSPAVHDFAW